MLLIVAVVLHKAYVKGFGYVMQVNIAAEVEGVLLTLVVNLSN